MLLEDLKLNIRTARAQRAARASAASSVSPSATSSTGTSHSWRRGRPFVGALLTMIAGVEMFFSGQLDVGNIHVSVGIEGLQSTVIPVILVTLGVLTLFMPQHRIFYGVISLVVSVYSLIGLNLGGFFIGMILGAVGGILVVSWMPKRVATDHGADLAAADVEALDLTELAAEPRPLVHSR